MDLKPPFLVLALPRGGVPVAAEIALAFHAPLDLLLVQKIGAPLQPELAVAAVVEGAPPDIIRNPETEDLPGVDDHYVASQLPAALHEIERRRRVYLQGRSPLAVQGSTVIVVDDGIATGTTMKAALVALKKRGAARVVVAVPVAPHRCNVMLSDHADEVVCLLEPRPFHAIGLHYLAFHSMRDEVVRQALEEADPAQPKDSASSNG